MRFSIEAQAFYDEDINYGKSLPYDVVSVTDEEYRYFIGKLNEGCHIYIEEGAWGTSDPRPDHYHVWDDDSNLWMTTEDGEKQRAKDNALTAERIRDALVEKANSEINWLQDAVDLNDATDEDAMLLQAWKRYRIALKRLNLSISQDIDWPQSPT